MVLIRELLMGQQQTLREAYKNGVYAEVNIEGRVIVYEPELNASCFTSSKTVLVVE